MKRKESDSVVNSQTGRHLMTKKNKSVSCSKNENDSIKIKNKISPNKRAYSSKNNQLQLINMLLNIAKLQV